MKAAIYIRVSTERQAEEGLSLEAQEKLLRGYCAQNGMEVTELYADEGISAKDTKHRPAFTKMMIDAETNKFEVIVFWKLTRFTRSTIDLLECVRRLENCGVGLVSCSEPINTVSAAGKMTTTVLAAMAQFERDMVSENVKMVADYRASDGKRTCSSVIGYDTLGKDSLVQNPAEAKIVKYIFDTFVKQQSFMAVSDACAKMHYRGKRGAVLKSWHIERILTCPVHAGYYSYHGSVIKGDFEPIVSIDTYNLVQYIIEDQYARLGRKRRRELIILE